MGSIVWGIIGTFFCADWSDSVFGNHEFHKHSAARHRAAVRNHWYLQKAERKARRVHCGNDYLCAVPARGGLADIRRLFGNKKDCRSNQHRKTPKIHGKPKKFLGFAEQAV